VVSYATVAQLANLIPVVGGMIAFVWTLILAVVGLQELHETPQGKAIVAVLLPVALCCACVGILMAIAGAGILAAFANQ
jgi:hypothetical protein